MKKSLLFVVTIFFVILSCDKDDDIFNQEDINFNEQENVTNCDDCGINITKDINRLEIFNRTVSARSIFDKTSSKSSGLSFDFTYLAHLDPLEVEFDEEIKQLNANHVTMVDKRIAVSYSIVGEPYGGAIDILNVEDGVELEGTLLIPDKDIDAVTFYGKKRLLFGGGLNMSVNPQASSNSFFEHYKINDRVKKNNNFGLVKKYEYSTGIGNKLSSLNRYKDDFIVGSGGANSGIVFAYDEESNKVVKDESGLMNGLFVLATHVAETGNSTDLVALAYNNDTKELKAFYFAIDIDASTLTPNFDVSLGTMNLNVEAKHTVFAIKEERIIVSLETEGIAVFEITEKNNNYSATKIQQFKSEILNPSNPDEAVNSFFFSSDEEHLYVAAGAAGIIILKMRDNGTLKLEGVIDVPGESVNSLTRFDNYLVVASTSGVSIYRINK